MRQKDVINILNFERWMSEDVGRVLHLKEQKWVRHAMCSDRVHNLLQLGGLPLLDFNLPHDCHYIHLEPSLQHQAQGHTVVADIHALPFANERFDCLILGHLLEIVSMIDLEEIIRVLAPGGVVYVFGFNLKGYCWFRNVVDKQFMPWSQQWFGVHQLKQHMKQYNCYSCALDYLSSYDTENGVGLKSICIDFFNDYFPQLSSLYMMKFIKMEKGHIPTGLARALT